MGNGRLQNRLSFESSREHVLNAQEKTRPLMVWRPDRHFGEVTKTQPKRYSRGIGIWEDVPQKVSKNSVTESSLKVISPREWNLRCALCETDVE